MALTPRAAIVAASAAIPRIGLQIVASRAAVGEAFEITMETARPVHARVFTRASRTAEAAVG